MRPYRKDQFEHFFFCSLPVKKFGNICSKCFSTILKLRSSVINETRMIRLNLKT